MAEVAQGGSRRSALAALLAGMLAAAPAAAFELPGGKPSPFDLKRWTTETTSVGANRYNCDPPRCAPPGSASFRLVAIAGERARTACENDFKSFDRSQDGTLVRNNQPLRTRVYAFASLSRGDVCGLIVMLRYSGEAEFCQIRIVYRGGTRYSVDGRAMTQAQARQNEATLSRALGLIR